MKCHHTLGRAGCDNAELVVVHCVDLVGVGADGLLLVRATNLAELRPSRPRLRNVILVCFRPGHQLSGRAPDSSTVSARLRLRSSSSASACTSVEVKSASGAGCASAASGAGRSLAVARPALTGVEERALDLRGPSARPTTSASYRSFLVAARARRVGRASCRRAVTRLDVHPPRDLSTMRGRVWARRRGARARPARSEHTTQRRRPRTGPSSSLLVRAASAARSIVELCGPRVCGQGAHLVRQAWQRVWLDERAVGQARRGRRARRHLCVHVPQAQQGGR